MNEQDARDVITAVVGPMDRPWDTRCAVALYWARHCRVAEDPPTAQVETAITALGYPLVECDPDGPGLVL